MAGESLTNTAAGRCPHCGALAAASSKYPTIDKPFEQCLGCGALLARSGANEWDLLRPRAKLAHVGRHALRILVLGTPPALIYVGAAIALRGEWKPVEAALWLGAGWFLAASWVGTRLSTRIQRSRRRMGDPMYLAKLIEFQLLASRRPAPDERRAALG